MIDDRNDIRQAFAGPRASSENVVPAGTRPANRIGLVLIEPKDLAVALVFASTKDPAAFGVEHSLGHQVVTRSCVLKRRIELDQRVRPEATLIKTGRDEAIDAFVPNSNEAANVGGIVVDQPFAKFKYVHAAAPGA